MYYRRLAGDRLNGFFHEGLKVATKPKNQVFKFAACDGFSEYVCGEDSKITACQTFTEATREWSGLIVATTFGSAAAKCIGA